VLWGASEARVRINKEAVIIGRYFSFKGLTLIENCFVHPQVWQMANLTFMSMSILPPQTGHLKIVILLNQI
jgi:hypothetical protein